MTREKSCFVFAIFDAVVIVIGGLEMVLEFLKARIGQQNRPLNMALKALLRTCVWIPSLASEWQTLLKGTSVLESGAQMVER